MVADNFNERALGGINLNSKEEENNDVILQLFSCIEQIKQQSSVEVKFQLGLILRQINEYKSELEKVKEKFKKIQKKNEKLTEKKLSSSETVTAAFNTIQLAFYYNAQIDSLINFDISTILSGLPIASENINTLKTKYNELLKEVNASYEKRIITYVDETIRNLALIISPSLLVTLGIQSQLFVVFEKIVTIAGTHEEKEVLYKYKLLLEEHIKFINSEYLWYRGIDNDSSINNFIFKNRPLKWSLTIGIHTKILTVFRETHVNPILENLQANSSSPLLTNLILFFKQQHQNLIDKDLLAFSNKLPDPKTLLKEARLNLTDEELEESSSLLKIIFQMFCKVREIIGNLEATILTASLLSKKGRLTEACYTHLPKLFNDIFTSIETDIKNNLSSQEKENNICCKVFKFLVYVEVQLPALVDSVKEHQNTHLTKYFSQQISAFKNLPNYLVELINNDFPAKTGKDVIVKFLYKNLSYLFNLQKIYTLLTELNSRHPEVKAFKVKQTKSLQETLKYSFKHVLIPPFFKPNFKKALTSLKDPEDKAIAAAYQKTVKQVRTQAIQLTLVCIILTTIQALLTFKIFKIIASKVGNKKALAIIVIGNILFGGVILILYKLVIAMLKRMYENSKIEYDNNFKKEPKKEQVDENSDINLGNESKTEAVKIEVQGVAKKAPSNSIPTQIDLISEESLLDSVKPQVQGAEVEAIASNNTPQL